MGHFNPIMHLNLIFILAPYSAKYSCGFFSPNCHYPCEILMTRIYYISVFILWPFGGALTVVIAEIFCISEEPSFVSLGMIVPPMRMHAVEDS